MIVIIDERQTVVGGFVALLEGEGVAATGLCSDEFIDWIELAPSNDLLAVEAFLVGECAERARLCRLIAERSSAVVIAISEARSLDETLELFAVGIDDVVRKPVHVKEILARIKSASRRTKAKSNCEVFEKIRLYADGRDPDVDGEPLPLPRRELRILAYLFANVGGRVSKTQIFNAVYGLFNEEIDESVIESHISKLRKRLRMRLGYDPIELKRFLGYRLIGADVMEGELIGHALAVSSTQDNACLMTRELQLVQDEYR